MVVPLDQPPLARFTNVISITDGQIFLETDLFNAGIRPAINAGISVSRVGGAAQTKVIKKLSGGIRTDLAQYRELAAFAQFASDLDEATRKQLDRGARVTELLKQAQYSPLSISLMAASLFAANKGFLDDVAVTSVLSFESGLHNFLKTSHAALLAKIEETKQLDKDGEAAMAAAIADKSASIQRAIAAENKEREKRALANLDIIDAQKDSATMVIRATGKAEAMKKEQQNLTPMYVEYVKWLNAGKDVPRVPQVTGNAVMMKDLK